MASAYEAEKMTVEVMERLLNGAYNDVTFKNALVCALDWCNWHRCTHIHKDTRIGVNSEGVRIEKYAQVKKDDKYQLTDDASPVTAKDYFRKENGKYIWVSVGPSDNPAALGLYEYVNPSDLEHNWYEKIQTSIEYSEVSKVDISYYDSPKNNGWYEREDETCYASMDEHCTGTYIELANPGSGASPRDNDWYEYVNGSYIPSSDINVSVVKTYYMCVYKKYYKQISRQIKEYVKTTDTIVNPEKTYYVEKNVDHYEPVDPEGWDYSDHYERNIDITVPGADYDITLQNRRPITI